MFAKQKVNFTRRSKNDFFSSKIQKNVAASKKNQNEVNSNEIDQYFNSTKSAQFSKEPEPPKENLVNRNEENTLETQIIFEQGSMEQQNKPAFGDISSEREKKLQM